MRSAPILPSLLVLCALASPARAQAPAPPSNADVLGRLGAACVTDVPAPESFHLALRGASPYLRSALGTAFTAAGRRLTADTTAARLAVDVERAAVTYARAGRGRLRRTAALRLRLQVHDATGALRYDEACTREASDVVAARQRPSLEDALWPETQGTAPPPSRLRRTLEIGLVAGTIVTSTLLLFSLRSR